MIEERHTRCVFAVIERETGITPEQIRSPQRNRHCVEARQIACMLFHRLGYSDEEVASVINRERTVVVERRAVHNDLVEMRNTTYLTKFDSIVLQFELARCV